MIDTSWSRLLNTPIGQFAAEAQDNDPKRKYHVFTGHIQQCIQHAQLFDYDPNLDLAILFHDFVYDELPDKEKRSADAFLEAYKRFGPIDGVDPQIVVKLILSTITHSMSDYDDPRMMIIDLLDLSSIDLAKSNFYLARDESVLLYGISDREFVQANHDFMIGLLARVKNNINIDSVNATIWSSITTGIEWLIGRTAAYLEF